MKQYCVVSWKYAWKETNKTKKIRKEEPFKVEKEEIIKEYFSTFDLAYERALTMENFPYVNDIRIDIYFMPEIKIDHINVNFEISHRGE